MGLRRQLVFRVVDESALWDERARHRLQAAERVVGVAEGLTGRVLNTGESALVGITEREAMLLGRMVVFVPDGDVETGVGVGDGTAIRVLLGAHTVDHIQSGGRSDVGRRI